MNQTIDKNSVNELLSSFSRKERFALNRTPQQRDQHLLRVFRFQWIGFFLLLGISLFLFWQFGVEFTVQHPFLLVIIVLVATGRHIWQMFSLWGGKVYRLENASRRIRGSLTPKRVSSLIDNVRERFGGIEKPNVYIAVDKQANAWSINSMFFNFIPRYNAVFLNSYLSKALSAKEQEAILVHELAHFYRYIGPLGRNVWLSVVMAVAASITVLTWEPDLTNPVATLMVVWWAPLPFQWVFNIMASIGRHDLEYACDVVAAEVVGAEAMTNALLKIGDRAEVYELVEQEMERQLEMDPKARIEMITQTLLDRIPEKPVDLAEAKRALRLKPHAAPGGDRKKNKKFLEEVRKNHKLRMSLKVMPWSRFDTIYRDGWLDRAELSQYVRSLASDQNAATHEVASEHPAQEHLQTHPSMRHRIIYLYLHFLAV
ncbi:MAG: M48 family metalloprotease [Saprospiraceae bacterium]|nr:M48 family metalloprotease [Saprospiraceae bacterium]